MKTIVVTWKAAGDPDAAVEALTSLAHAVEAGEPGTWTYLVHTRQDDPTSIVFIEMYADGSAFQAHLNGPTFQAFTKEHGDLFVCDDKGPVFDLIALERRAGFVRSEAC